MLVKIQTRDRHTVMSVETQEIYTCVKGFFLAPDFKDFPSHSQQI